MKEEFEVDQGTKAVEIALEQATAGKRGRGGPDLFAHFSQVIGDGFKTLHDNQSVEFEGEDSPRD